MLCCQSFLNLLVSHSNPAQISTDKAITWITLKFTVTSAPKMELAANVAAESSKAKQIILMARLPLELENAQDTPDVNTNMDTKVSCVSERNP